jgi:hypothetical protein
MNDLTAEDPGTSEGSSSGAVGTSDDDINAELDVDMAEALEADHGPEDDAADERSTIDQRSEFDEGLGT